MLQTMVPLGLGIAYAAVPGVVNAESLRRGVTGGFRPAFLIQLGSIVGDGIWAIIALAGLAALANHAQLLSALGFAGGLFFCRIAFDAFRTAWRTHHDSSSAPSNHAHFRTGAVFGLANPAGLAFWAGAGGGLIATRGHDPQTVIAFMLMFLAGALCWCVGFSLLVASGRQYARPNLIRGIDAICGTILGYFGIRLLWTTLRRWAIW